MWFQMRDGGKWHQVQFDHGNHVSSYCCRSVLQGRAFDVSDAEYPPGMVCSSCAHSPMAHPLPMVDTESICALVPEAFRRRNMKCYEAYKVTLKCDHPDALNARMELAGHVHRFPSKDFDKAADRQYQRWQRNCIIAIRPPICCAMDVIRAACRVIIGGEEGDWDKKWHVQLVSVEALGSVAAFEPEEFGQEAPE